MGITGGAHRVSSLVDSTGHRVVPRDATGFHDRVLEPALEQTPRLAVPLEHTWPALFVGESAASVLFPCSLKFFRGNVLHRLDSYDCFGSRFYFNLCDVYAPNPICSVVLLMTAIFGGGATVATT